MVSSCLPYPFSELPVEILLEIIKLLCNRLSDDEDEDIGNLSSLFVFRLVCKSFAEIAAAEFLRLSSRKTRWYLPARIESCFCEVRYTSRPRSVETFTAVIQSPAFGHLIRIVTYNFCSPKWIEPAIQQTSQWDKFINRVAMMARSNKLEAAAVNNDHLVKLENAVKNRPDILQLVVIRTGLVPFSLLKPLRAQWEGFLSLLKLLLRATYQPHRPIVSIRCVDVNLFAQARHFLAPACEAFAFVTDVQMSFNVTQLQWAKNMDKGWPRVLASACNLVRLQIRLINDLSPWEKEKLEEREKYSNSQTTISGNLLRSLLANRIWTHLAQLDLHNFDICSGNLSDFLRNHSHTLHTLRMIRVGSRGNLWRHFLQMIRNRLNLEYGNITFNSFITDSEDFKQFCEEKGFSVEFVVKNGICL